MTANSNTRVSHASEHELAVDNAGSTVCLDDRKSERACESESESKRGGWVGGWGAEFTCIIFGKAKIRRS